MKSGPSVWLIIIGLLFQLDNLCYSQSENSDALTLDERVELLKKYYADKNEQAFFDVYPDEFDCFVDVFGYKSTSNTDFQPGPLYEDGLEIIWYLFDLSLTDQLVMQKVVNLFKDGTWQADGVNYLRHRSRTFIEERLKLAVKEVNKLDEKSIGRFWQFYFDGPHPKSYKEDFDRLFAKVKNVDVKMSELMKQAYQGC